MWFIQKTVILIWETFVRLLRQNELYAKLSKCEFAKNTIDFCGFIVDKNGIRAQPNKLDVIRLWPVPTNVKEIRRFIGICGYCCWRYIKSTW